MKPSLLKPTNIVVSVPSSFKVISTEQDYLGACKGIQSQDVCVNSQCIPETRFLTSIVHATSQEELNMKPTHSTKPRISPINSNHLAGHDPQSTTQHIYTLVTLTHDFQKTRQSPKSKKSSSG